MAKNVFWVAIPLSIAAITFGIIFAPIPKTPQKPIVISKTNDSSGNPVPVNPIVEGAKLQLQNPAKYTGKYYKIPYPNGDVPLDRGACTDVVIRALRHAGIDLQQAIHEDAKFAPYPRMLVPDKSIDHRRCPNQMIYFSRHAQEFPTNSKTQTKQNIQPGDIIFWKLPGNLDHVGIASDKFSRAGHPFIIHNIGPEAAEQDVLFRWPIVAHFRMTPESQ